MRINASVVAVVHAYSPSEAKDPTKTRVASKALKPVDRLHVAAFVGHWETAKQPEELGMEPVAVDPDPTDAPSK